MYCKEDRSVCSYFFSGSKIFHRRVVESGPNERSTSFPFAATHLLYMVGGCFQAIVVQFQINMTVFILILIVFVYFRLSVSDEESGGPF